MTFRLIPVFIFMSLIGAVASAQDSSEAIRFTREPVVEHADTNAAVIAWSTNISSGTVLHYGTASKDLNQTAEEPWGGFTHRVTLKNLQPGTIYYFEAVSDHAQGSGAAVISSLERFQTPRPGEAESNVSVIAGPTINAKKASAQINWKTNMRSSTVLKFGTDPNHLTETREAPWGQQNHSLDLAHLQPNRTYYLEIQTTTGRVMKTGSFKTGTSTAAAKQQ